MQNAYGYILLLTFSIGDEAKGVVISARPPPLQARNLLKDSAPFPETGKAQALED